MTSTIQIPNITINGNDYWNTNKSQYNTMIGESITPLTIDLVGYPTNNLITIEDPTEEYYYTDNSDNEIVNYSLQKGSSLTIKIGKMPEFWEVPRELTAQGVYGYPSSNFTVTLPDSVTTIGDDGLLDCFNNCDTITSLNLNNVTTIGNYGIASCCYGSDSLVSVYGNNITTIAYEGMSNSFYRCTALTTLSIFNNITTIENRGMYFTCGYCSNLTNAITFSKLNSIGSYGLMCCFYSSGITSISFPALTSTSFGSYTNQFNSMLSGVTGCTVHFPSNLQSVIGSWSDVTRGFSGTNTTVLFDLSETS